MKKYERPVLNILPETTEGIYAASGSGDKNKETCRFGRKKFSPHSRTCRSCYASGGTSNFGTNFGYEHNAEITCIDGLQ